MGWDGTVQVRKETCVAVTAEVEMRERLIFNRGAEGGG